MRLFPRIALATTALLLSATLARAAGPVPPGYGVAASETLAGGVEHVTISRTNPAQSVQVARISPGQPVALATVSAHDAVSHSVSQQELPSDMCRRVDCIVGVNADFHDTNTDEPFGGVVSGGRLVRSPSAADQLTVAHNGTLQAGRLDWSGSLTAADGTTTALGGFNVDRVPGAVLLYTPAWGAPTPAGASGELVLRATGPVGVLEATTPLQIVGFRTGPGPVPADGAVLSADGDRANALAALWARVKAHTLADTLQLTVHAGAGDVAESIGVRPILLRDGKRVFPPLNDGLTAFRAPRTLVGWNAAGEVVIVTVDGRQDTGAGMTLADASDLLLALGATDGVNFDGGGGTTFVVDGTVTNLPSDPSNPGPPSMPGGHVVAPGHVERLAPNALVVVSRPVDPPTTTTTTAPPGGGTNPPTTGPSTPTTGDTTPFDPVFGTTDGGGNVGQSPAPDPLGIFNVATDGSGGGVLTAVVTPTRGQRSHSKQAKPTTGTTGFLGGWLDGVVPKLPMPAGAAAEGQSALAAGARDDRERPSPVVPALVALGGVTGLGGAVILAGERRRRRSRARRALWL